MKKLLVLFCLIASPVWAQSTTTFTSYINALPATVSVNSSDYLYVLHSGVSEKATVSDIFSSTGAVTPSGTFTTGDILVGLASTSAQDSSAVTTALLPTSLSIYKGSAGVNYGAGSISSPANAFIWQSNPATADDTGANSATGICSDSNVCTTSLFVTGRDTVDASGASNGFYSYIFRNNFGGTGAKGGHHVMLTEFNIVATPDDTGQSYSGSNIRTSVSVPISGADVFGGNTQLQLKAGTSIHQGAGYEIDVNPVAGITINQIVGMQIVNQVHAGAMGSDWNAALSFNGAYADTTGWPTLIDGGAYAGYSGLASTGTIFKCTGHTASTNCGTIGSGIDLDNYTTVTNYILRGPQGNGYIDGSFNIVAPRVEFNKNIVYSGGSWTSAETWLDIDNLTISGTAQTQPTSGRLAPLHLFIGSDTVDTTTSGSGALYGMTVQDRPATGFTGNRIAIGSYMNVGGTPATLGQGQIASLEALTRINANLTGTAGAYANYKGAVFGGNTNVFSTSAATFLSEIVSLETDTTLVASSSAAEKHSLLVVLGSTDAVRATYDDSAIEFSAQGNSLGVGWLYGISFGAYAHIWPFAVDSTLIGAQTQTVGGPTSDVALWGIDFSAVTFQAGGGFLNSVGFSVDPSGNTKANSYSVGATAGVDCTGVTAGTVVVTKGLVTHC